MKQERRSFLRQAVGVLLAPLGMEVGTISKQQFTQMTILFPDGSTLGFQGRVESKKDGETIIGCLGGEKIYLARLERLT